MIHQLTPLSASLCFILNALKSSQVETAAITTAEEGGMAGVQVTGNQRKMSHEVSAGKKVDSSWNDGILRVCLGWMVTDDDG